ncbi:MAG: hypothetical protein IJV82_05975 [Oscillospiraceae bacterium]|nr:hypothetical protein [Oscillospiraceae bacterium]
MDIKAKINEIVDKVKNDKDFESKFKSDPVGAVEGLLGVDVPNDQVEKIIDTVKAKISLDKLGGLFGR